MKLLLPHESPNHAMKRYAAENIIKVIAFGGGALLMAVALFALTSCSNNRAQSRAETASSSGHDYSHVDSLRRVHFAFGSDELDAEAMDTLKGNVVWLERHAHEVLVVEGHCDEWGDAAFNLQLGDRRARRVKAFLMAQGIDPHRLIMVVSYGEQRPLDPRHTPDAWRQNRRVEFIVR